MAGEYEGEVVWFDLKNGERKGAKTDPCYAKAVTADLNALIGFTLESEYHLITMDLPSGNDVNVWAIRDRSEPNKYSVYFQNDYRFSLERVEKGWEAYTVRVINPGQVHEHVVRLITSRIDAKLQ
jgi:hypothetical protein